MEDKNHLENIRRLASLSDAELAVAEIARQCSPKQWIQGLEEKTGNTASRASCFSMLLIKLKARHNILTPALCEIIERHKVVGVSTSGVRFDARHINPSFTEIGIALGNRTSVS